MTYKLWLLNPPHKTNYNCLTWNYYSKYIYLTNPPHTNNNLTKLTAHIWITSNPSCLLGTKLDRIILQLKNFFKERNIPYPLIYNSYDLLLMLDKLHITNMYDLCLKTFDFTRAIIMSCKLLNLSNFYGDYLLNLNKNKTLLLLVIPPISYLGVTVDSYHSRQIIIVELLLSLSEFSLFNNT